MFFPFFLFSMSPLPLSTDCYVPYPSFPAPANMVRRMLWQGQQIKVLLAPMSCFQGTRVFSSGLVPQTMNKGDYARLLQNRNSQLPKTVLYFCAFLHFITYLKCHILGSPFEYRLHSERRSWSLYGSKYVKHSQFSIHCTVPGDTNFCGPRLSPSKHSFWELTACPVCVGQ